MAKTVGRRTFPLLRERRRKADTAAERVPQAWFQDKEFGRMGMQFFRAEIALLLRIQLFMAAAFVLISVVLLLIGLGSLHPFRLLWAAGGVCLAADAVITVILYQKWEKKAGKNGQ